jgi:hypothetical protein
MPCGAGLAKECLLTFENSKKKLPVLHFRPAEMMALDGVDEYGNGGGDLLER